MIRISQIRLSCGHPQDALEQKIRKALRLESDVQLRSGFPTSGLTTSGLPTSGFPEIQGKNRTSGDRRTSGSSAGAMVYRITGHSVDARKKPQLFDIYTVEVETGLSAKKETALIHRARNKNVTASSPDKWRFPEQGSEPLLHRPVIIGAGPAGLFCALLLAEHGYRPLLIERGKCMEERMADVEAFWEGTGPVSNHSTPDSSESAAEYPVRGFTSNTDPDPNSNVQFGEGGAGTFSDGKLNTQINDRTGRARYVLQTFVEAGAPPAILYEGKPHIGTDRLRIVIPNLRRRIEAAGGEIRFRTVCESFVFEDIQTSADLSGNEMSGEKNASDSAVSTLPERRLKGIYIRDLSRPSEPEFLPAEAVVLAIGHSARDTLEEIYRLGIPMEQKKFAVGLRVAHPQTMIDESQYGTGDPAVLASMRLSAAPYKLTAKASSGRGVYSFCMCPGGYIVNASSEAGHLCVNGMSDENRDSGWANSAIVVTVGEEEYGSPHVLAGMHFQRELEKKAYKMGQGSIPVQYYTKFREAFEKTHLSVSLSEPGTGHCTRPFEGVCTVTGTESAQKQETAEEKRSSSRPCQDPPVFAARGACRTAPLDKLLPEGLTRDFIEGMEQFGKKIRGFNGPQAVVAGIESRTSSPVRIPRGDNLQSTGAAGLYPCGEGAGYAGGIMSAAMDGMRTAEAIARRYKADHWEKN